MNTQAATIATAGAPAPVEPSALIRRLLAAVRTFFVRRRETALLRDMDDRMLRDMGLNRYDLAKCEWYWL